ncbi:MAG TPA: hypothetical protein VM733_08250 [Thermoanaerobaculia bacterium]|nr:hypothetical protein [Thermoanaerobaculia bacterium]
MTWLFEAGRWEITGSTVDVAGNPNALIGFATIAHSDDSWDVQEQLNENASRYDVRPPRAGLPATTFTGTHAIMGPVQGAYAFFEDMIVMSYRSDDNAYAATEVFRHIDDDRCDVRGALFLHGGHVSSWSLTMQRK